MSVIRAEKCNCDIHHRNNYHGCPHSLAFPFVDDDASFVPVEYHVKGPRCLILKNRKLLQENGELKDKLRKLEALNLDVGLATLAKRQAEDTLACANERIEKLEQEYCYSPDPPGIEGVCPSCGNSEAQQRPPYCKCATCFTVWNDETGMVI